MYVKKKYCNKIIHEQDDSINQETINYKAVKFNPNQCPYQLSIFYT